MSADSAGSTTSTTSTFISALVVAAITVTVFSGFLLIVHNKAKYRRVYQSRLELAPEGHKPRPLPDGIIPWWKAVLLETPDTDIIAMNGLDAYFFVRFLKVFGLYMLVPYVLLTFIILIPVSAYSPNNGNTGLNALTFGNVPANNQDRHIAHFLVEIILVAWTLYLIHREYAHLVHMRQQWLHSEDHVRSGSSRTVMLTNVPKEKMTEEALKEMSAPPNVEGPVNRTIWLAKKTKAIEKVFNDRNKECLRLEAAESKVMKLAAKNVAKGKVTPPDVKSQPLTDKPAQVAETTGGGINIDPENRTNKTDALMDRYLLPKQKKKKTAWKQGFLGLFGNKVDFKSSPAFIRSKNEELEKMRAEEAEMEIGNVAWIRFPTQDEAHAFARTIGKQKGNMMVQTGIEVHPDDVIWSNTSQNPYQRKVGLILGIAAVTALIIFWIPLTVFVGAITSIDAMCKWSWMSWVCKIPSAPLGIIKGVLPPLILSIMLSLVPPIFKLMLNKIANVPRHTEIEVKLFNRYACFVYVHGFLIVTLSSGLLSALSDIGGQLSQVPTLLATNLPGASIFFLTFVMASTWSSSAKAFSRAIPLVMYLLSPILLGSTPRKRWAGQTKMASFSFGTIGPSITLLNVIVIVYAPIQPIITGVGMVAFALLYASYKYLLVYAADQPEHMETGGLLAMKFFNCVFASIYLSLVCLMGLMFLSTDENGKRATSGLACGAILAVCLGLTAAYNIWINHFRFPKNVTYYSHSSVVPGTQSTAQLALAETHATDEGTVAASPGLAAGSHSRSFDHPALWEKQKPLWLAQDTLGFGVSEVDRLTDENLDASCQGAYMDAKGKLEVQRPPPEEDDPIALPKA